MHTARALNQTPSRIRSIAGFHCDATILGLSEVGVSLDVGYWCLLSIRSPACWRGRAAKLNFVETSGANSISSTGKYLTINLVCPGTQTYETKPDRQRELSQKSSEHNARNHHRSAGTEGKLPCYSFLEHSSLHFQSLLTIT